MVNTSTKGWTVAKRNYENYYSFICTEHTCLPTYT